MDTIVNSIQPITPTSTSESAYDTLFSEYERVIMHSLITSFGLDLFINDQHGGDVDTIHNVRKIGVDKDMRYKDKKNEDAYNNREKYDYSAYHSDQRFACKKAQARKEYNETGIKTIDAYTGNRLEHTKASAVPKDVRAELDHVVECKAINEDRGRVLSGISGVDLANQDDNLAWTNKSLNASMGAWAKSVNDKYRKEHGCDAPLDMTDMEAYIKAHPDLDKQTVERMRAQYKKSRDCYERRLAYTYYTSSNFLKATAKASTKVALKMGLREAVGLIFSEIWFSVRDEMRSAVGKTKSFLSRIGSAIKRGFENAKRRYKEIWNKFISGSIAGFLSSITTTLCNIFFTTAKNVVKIIRQSWASLVQAAKILFFNPDCLPVGEKFRAAAKVLATGASVVVGTIVGDLIHKTGVGAIPVLGEIITVFCSSLVTGIMSCSLLYMLDHNSAINKIIEILNKIPSVANYVVYFREQAALLDEYAAKLFDINLDLFKKEISLLSFTLSKLDTAKSVSETNNILKDIYFNQLRFTSPFGDCDNIDEFMSDRTKKLIYK